MPQYEFHAQPNVDKPSNIADGDQWLGHEQTSSDSLALKRRKGRDHASNIDDIVRRDIDFSVDETLPKNWHSGSPHITHFYNAMSVLFPEGERMFIRAVRHHKDAVTDPALLADIQGFIGQEAMHGREHQQYNDALKAQGYDVDEMEQRSKGRIAWAEKHLPASRMLCATIVLEHFTAILANQVLSHDANTGIRDERMERLWRWHAVEETEHKGVAYDVWQTVFKDRPFTSYRMRVMVMMIITVHFTVQVSKNLTSFLRTDGQRWNLRGWAKLTWYLWGKPGPLLRMIPQWLAWFRPGFHPWQHDNRELLKGWQEKFNAEAKLNDH